jgi:hypothetical protein
MRALYRAKESQFWSNRIAGSSGNSKKFWKSISSVLLCDRRTSTHPSPEIAADRQAQFFTDEVNGIRAATENAALPDVHTPRWTTAGRRSGDFHGGCSNNSSAFPTENLRVGSTANIRSARYGRRLLPYPSSILMRAICQAHRRQSLLPQFLERRTPTLMKSKTIDPFRI